MERATKLYKLRGDHDLFVSFLIPTAYHARNSRLMTEHVGLPHIRRRPCGRRGRVKACRCEENYISTSKQTVRKGFT